MNIQEKKVQNLFLNQAVNVIFTAGKMDVLIQHWLTY